MPKFNEKTLQFELTKSDEKSNQKRSVYNDREPRRTKKMRELTDEQLYRNAVLTLLKRIAKLQEVI